MIWYNLKISLRFFVIFVYLLIFFVSLFIRQTALHCKHSEFMWLNFSLPLLVPFAFISPWRASWIVLSKLSLAFYNLIFFMRPSRISNCTWNALAQFHQISVHFLLNRKIRLLNILHYFTEQIQHLMDSFFHPFHFEKRFWTVTKTRMEKITQNPGNVDPKSTYCTSRCSHYQDTVRWIRLSCWEAKIRFPRPFYEIIPHLSK